MKPQHLSLQQIKGIDLVDYLQKLGHVPQKIRGADHWYLSPLHPEKEPSFKVNRKLNAWYDHGLGQGGNLVDFGILFYDCSVKELLKKMSGSLSFHPQKLPVLLAQNEPLGIKIAGTGSLAHPALLRYLSSRSIPLEVAKCYCEEVHFELHSKAYYAIGFGNNSGGYELRNRYFKGSSSPKDVTLIERNGAAELAVFEGFFSFLSYLVLYRNEPQPLTNFLVLNSLSFFNRSMELMEQHPKISLYLDNDAAGNACTALAVKTSSKFSDRRTLYKGHKDLNSFLIWSHQAQHPKQGLRP
jgi:hypothetical protein